MLKSIGINTMGQINMGEERADQSNGNKVAYEKPLFEEQPGMVFPKQILEKINGGRFCVQCSACHGCR